MKYEEKKKIISFIHVQVFSLSIHWREIMIGLCLFSLLHWDDRARFSKSINRQLYNYWTGSSGRTITLFPDGYRESCNERGQDEGWTTIEAALSTWWDPLHCLESIVVLLSLFHLFSRAYKFHFCLQSMTIPIWDELFPEGATGELFRSLCILKALLATHCITFMITYSNDY